MLNTFLQGRLLRKKEICTTTVKNNAMANIYWKELVEKLKNGTVTEEYEVDFNNEQIHFKDVALLNRNGIQVPEHLVFYDDNDIDFSDDPELSDEEIEKIKLTQRIVDSLPIEPEIKEWIKKERIDVNALLADVIVSFYKTIKNINKNAAL